ncbi:MAG: NTP transferase domain-containing protein, partial [bacterium]
MAAGEGSRLAAANGVDLKPMVRVMGLSLAERTLCTCAKAGVRRFLVVLGHRSEEVRAHFKEIARRRGFEVETTVADDWALGNGASLLAASGRVGEEPFLITMVDHILDCGIYNRLLEAPPREGEICLAVDRNCRELFDERDTTKVCLTEDRVRAIGKDLRAWDAADTGVFLCTRAIFEGLGRARLCGRHTLTDGVAELAEEGMVRAVDVTGKDWVDVDVPEALREAGRRLAGSIRKGKGNEDGLLSSWLNRPISVRLSVVLARTRITPNQITVASFLLALAGAGFFAPGTYALALLGGFLLQAASILDGCDGEVARLKESGSVRGAWLDSVLDRYADLAAAVAITFGYAGTHPGSLPWIAGMLAGGSFLLASFVTKEYQLRYGVAYPNDMLNRLKHRDIRLFFLFLGSLAGVPFAALLLSGVLTHLLIA